MAYSEKSKYPTIKKPGVYPSGSVKELGLNNDNLEKFSLGNWEEYKKNNVQVLNPYDLGTSEDITPLPDFLLEDLQDGEIEVSDLNHFTDENLRVSAQSMRYSPDGTKLFVLTREPKGGSQNAPDTTINNDTVGITNDDIFTAKHILTYNLDTPYITFEGIQLVDITDFHTNLPFMPFYQQTIVDFHVSANRIIFLSQDQPSGNYQRESFCQLNSFKLQEEFNISSYTYPADYHPFVLSPEELDGVEIFNAKSFDIVENGTKLFILHGTSPLYQTPGISQGTGTNGNFNYRIDNDVDYLTGFSMITDEEGASDIRSLSIIPGNQREIFKKNPMRVSNQSNNLRFFDSYGQGEMVDWSGLAAPTDIPRPFEGNPSSNPIFMSDEPWFTERDVVLAGVGRTHMRELGAICPRCIRFHPTKQKMFIYGMIVAEGFANSEKDGGYATLIPPQFAFKPAIFQYDFNFNYDIENSYYKSRINFFSYNAWTPQIEFFGFELVSYDLDIDPKVTFLITRNGRGISNGEATPSSMTISQYINQMVIIEEENEEVNSFIFLNQTSEFYQKFQSLINIPPNSTDEPFTPPTDETFEVHTFTNETDLNTISISEANDKSSFTYYNTTDDNYINTSFPVKVFLGMNLVNSTTGNDSTDLSYTGTPLITQWLEQSNPNEGTSFDISNITPNDSNFKFKVIQWGDEKTLLTNEQIINSEYFINYDEDSNLYKYKRFFYTIKDFIPMRPNSNQMNLISHIYNEPGVKSIKIIVIRFSKNDQWILETSLITKNIVINDGNFQSQNFSIFGGTNFNFLPLSDKEIIIGGLDEDSKYNTSIEKIKKDDNFIEKDYLEQASSREFIDNFNKKLYGEQPGQLDLGINRVFKGSYDIYDFITDDKQSIIDNNFQLPSGDENDKLPINSSATDIFINDEKCIVDLNPQDIEYLTIPNKVGIRERGILIGDYKINQPKDGAVQRVGLMQTPMLEKNKDKQVF